MGFWLCNIRQVYQIVHFGSSLGHMKFVEFSKCLIKIKLNLGWELQNIQVIQKFNV